jgi:hypothetical protein
MTSWGDRARYRPRGSRKLVPGADADRLGGRDQGQRLQDVPQVDDERALYGPARAVTVGVREPARDRLKSSQTRRTSSTFRIADRIRGAGEDRDLGVAEPWLPVGDGAGPGDRSRHAARVRDRLLEPDQHVANVARVLDASRGLAAEVERSTLARALSVGPDRLRPEPWAAMRLTQNPASGASRTPW